MRVLFVTPDTPWPPTYGGLLRSARLIEQFHHRATTRVVVLNEPPKNHPYPPRTEFIPLPARHASQPPPSRGWRQRFAVLKGAMHPRPELFRQHQQAQVTQAFRRLRSLAAEHDVCWVSWPYFAETALDAWPNARVVADYVDVGALAQGSQLHTMPTTPHKLFTWVDTVKMAWYERRVARRAWRSVVCKEEDGQFLRQARKVFVVPNGTDPRPQLDPADEEPSRLLFVGLMSFLPNTDAARWFAGECLPLLADLPIRLDLVGRDPPVSVRELHDGRRVHVHGFAPDLTDMYRRASVAVAPIRLGSGTKLKVLEALAFGKALVATGEAVRGIDIRHGVEYLRADTPGETAEACRRLIADPSLRVRLGQAGRQRVEERYTWDRVGDLAQRAITP